MEKFDVVIIGSGPGGYVAAIRSGQLGLKTALVEKDKELGGTCLNVGCIPSKALLTSSDHLMFVKKEAAKHGIVIDGARVDLAKMQERKNKVVKTFNSGVRSLMKTNKVTVIEGLGTISAPGKVSIKSSSGETQEIEAKNIVIATGSTPVELPFMKFDGKTIVSSAHAIAFDSVPKKLVVGGGGVIGVELGSVWARLGADVTVVEFLPKIIATYDDDIIRNFTRIVQKQGLKIEVGAKVTGYAKGVLTAERDGKVLEFPADKVLVAVGRRPYTDNLGLDKAGVELDDKKRVKVDNHLRTTAKNIWAIGDVVAGPMLAHKAEEDGAAVAEWIAGKAGHVNWDLVPAIVYTHPEVASVGLGEDAAKAKGLAVNIGKFNFAANGRAIAANSVDGFVKIIADAKTDRILGAQILGNNAGELISEIVTHMEYGGSAEDLGRTIHAHPTMSEAIKEAGLAVSKSAIHGI